MGERRLLAGDGFARHILGGMGISRPVSTPFIGRRHELTEITELLAQPETRLVTLVGPAGVGKTRLGLEVVGLIADRFPDGVLAIQLADVGDSAGVIPAILRSAGAADAGALDPMAQLIDNLRPARCLLLLDNFEHLSDAAPVVARLLQGCEGLRILVTSRQPLRLKAEQAVTVAPLATPVGDVDTATDVMSFDAVALLVDRMQAVDHAFEMSNEVASALARICRHLDGLPLAIELVARLVRVLPVAAIAEVLEHRLPHLVHGPVDAPDRHRTMRDAIAWSVELLDADAKRTFGHMSVFVGGWSLAAACAVLDQPDEAAVINALDELISQSLVGRGVGEDEARFQFLEVVREFAGENLVAAGEEASAQRRHALFYLASAEKLGENLTGSGMADALDKLERDRGNFERALRWAIAASAVDLALRLGIALRLLWYVRGSVRQGRDLFDQALALSRGSGGLRARALAEASTLARQQGDFAAAAVLAGKAVELARAAGDRRALGNALFQQGFVGHLRDDFGGARSSLEESAELARADRDPRGLAMALHHLGFVAAHADGDANAAWALQDEALLLALELGNRRQVATILMAKTELALMRHQHDAGWKLIREALGIIVELEDRPVLVPALQVGAALAADERRYVFALRLLGAIDSLERATGAAPWPTLSRITTQWLGVAEQSLGSRRAARLRAQGARLSPSDAAIYAQEGEDEEDPLTRREHEIAAWVGEGLTNREIASKLFLSERTVDGHVGRVLAKLGLRTRSQIAAWVATSEAPADQMLSSGKTGTGKQAFSR